MISKSEKQTREIAEKLTAKLKGGEVLALIGDLGSGKTVFAKGLAKALGVKQIVTSPTFVLMKVYVINLKFKTQNSKINTLAHIDAYRLNSGDDLAAIGALEYFKDKNCVTLIEWADRVKDILPKTAIMIKFKVKKDNQREITIKK